MCIRDRCGDVQDRRGPGRRHRAGAGFVGAAVRGIRAVCREEKRESDEMKKLQAVLPVSYTHLDVYKRQADERIGGFLSRDVENGADGAGTAEHLGARLLGRRAGYSPARDVYKRQT